MILGRRDAVIFDMDGTLLDSVPVVSAAYAAAIRDLGGPVLTSDEVVAAWHITDLLGSLQRSGLRLAVFTAATRRAASSMLMAAGLSDHFTVVVAGDEIAQPKPAPALGIHAAWGAKPGVRTWSHPVARHPRDVATLVGSSHLEGRSLCRSWSSRMSATPTSTVPNEP